MAHVIERYMTQVKNRELTDRLCEAMLKVVIDNLPTALREPGNRDAWPEIMWAGLTIILPAWMKYVYKAGVEKFFQFAVRVWGVEQDFDHPEKTALEGVEKYIVFKKSLGLPSSLSEIGIGEKDFHRIVERTRKYDKDTVDYFVKLANKDIVRLLQLCT